VIRIAPGLHGFTGLGGGRVYLIVDADGLTVVDAGTTIAVAPIVRQLGRLGRSPREVRRILVTHAHPDHVGGLPRLKELTGAEVWCSEPERPVVQGETPIPRPPPESLRGLAKLMRPGETTLPATRVDRVVADGETVGDGLVAVASPGHAPGHLAFWQPAQRTLLCGDAMMHLFGLRAPFGPFTVDQAEARRSIRRLAELEPELVLFGHGPPLHGAADRLRSLIATFPG
jgi:glyoxylase-like metal-dependent hydrolase (beta-lactamase superfamily II)